MGRPLGRPPLGDKAMTGAERLRAGANSVTRQRRRSASCGRRTPRSYEKSGG